MLESEIVIWHAWFVDIPQTKLMHFTSNDCTWEELPRDGMIGCVFVSEVRSDDRRSAWNFNGYDIYFKADGINGPIYGCDIEAREVNKYEEITKRYKNASIIRGIWTDEATMLYVKKKLRSVS